jgi:diguanylate cyclase (GGDEF)-like protein/PAS domain S-box-containing protein
MIFSVYALPSLASAVIIFSLFIFIVIYRRNSAGAGLVILLMIGFFGWSFGNGMVLLHSDLNQKIFWLNLSQVGPDFTPILWFFLSLEHTGRRNLLKNKWLYLVFVFPVLTTLIMWTNNWHHLLRRSITLGYLANHTTYLSIERGPWFYPESAYGYIFILLSFYLLFRFLNVSSARKQTLTILCSMFVPVLSNLLDIFQLNPLKPFGPTSIAFSITGIILAWGLYRQHFLDIAPIARNVVLEMIGDAVVVIDRQHRIVDINPASYHLFCIPCDSPSQLIGRKIEEVVLPWPEENEPLNIGGEARTQVALKVNEERCFYNVTTSSITNELNETLGWVIIFNDITEVKRVNESLQSQLDEINKLQDQLREQAIRDSLTGCFNRHYLNEILFRESSRANREKRTIGLMMLDIDHFKQINDTYGHIAGDRILQTLGEDLRMWVRVEDMVFRYGGEEFLIVLPGIPMQAFIARAQTLCNRIAALEIAANPETKINLTVSIGIALFPDHKGDIYQVLEYADRALYDAKHAGRNTIAVWKASE